LVCSSQDFLGYGLFVDVGTMIDQQFDCFLSPPNDFHAGFPIILEHFSIVQ